MHYKDLRVFQLAKKLQNELYGELIRIPFHWRTPEVNQAIRSSSSATSNIVEGHSRKYYPKDYCRFLIISMASSDETQNHVDEIFQKDLMDEERFVYFQKSYKKLSIQTLNLINKIKNFSLITHN
jgi:four helix bundle protein